MDLLTPKELEAADLTARLANLLSEIIAEPSRLCPPEYVEECKDVARWDWAEAAAAIHRIQNMIQSQAAARAFPDKFRLMGSIGEWRMQKFRDPAEMFDKPRQDDGS